MKDTTRNICVAALVAPSAGLLVAGWSFAILFTQSYGTAWVALIPSFLALGGTSAWIARRAPRLAWLLVLLLLLPAMLLFAWLFSVDANHTPAAVTLVCAFIVSPIIGLWNGTRGRKQ